MWPKNMWKRIPNLMQQHEHETPRKRHSSINWTPLSPITITNHKNYNFLACDWFKNVLFSTNSLAKLLLDSLLLAWIIKRLDWKLADVTVVTWWKFVTSQKWYFDRSVIIHPVIPVQKKLCESFRFFLAKANASICIGHLLVAYGLQIGRRKVFLKTFSNDWRHLAMTGAYTFTITNACQIRSPQESSWFSIIDVL